MNLELPEPFRDGFSPKKRKTETLSSEKPVELTDPFEEFLCDSHTVTSAGGQKSKLEEH